VCAGLATLMRKPRRLPRAAMEMQTIVVQYQPVTRAEIEQVRGASLLSRATWPPAAESVRAR
jgi:segregation and condensation protein B